MYNVQFQQPSYGQPPQRSQQQPHDVSNAVAAAAAAAAMGNDQKAFPSPLTTSSLDSSSSPKHPPGSPRPYPPTSRTYNSQQQPHQQPYNTPTPSFAQPSTSMAAAVAAAAAAASSGSMRPKDMSYYDQADQWTAPSASSYNKPSPQQQQAPPPPPPDASVDEEVQQHNMQILFEKKRRRRESHNAVERRRRDNINDRITDLATLLPDRDATKMNKGAILRKSVDHIRFLHDKLTEYQQHIQDLESLLSMYRLQRPGDPQQQQQRQQQQHHQSAATATASMMPQGHPLDLTVMQPHLGGPHDPFRRDG